MRGGPKFVIALAIVALLALGLGACGGSDSEDSTSTSAAATTEESTTPSGSDDRDSSDAGSTDEGSASFLTPGGDNSIQEFGEEADEEEVDRGDAALSAYLSARAKGDWATMCATLAKSTVAPIEQLGSKAPSLKGKDCAGILAVVLGRVPKSSRANTLTAGIASLRVEGDRGFALYHGAGDVDFFVPMVEEDGKWKVGAIAPNEFP